jgi:hypothetical protein
MNKKIALCGVVMAVSLCLWSISAQTVGKLFYNYIWETFTEIFSTMFPINRVHFTEGHKLISSYMS